MVFKSLHLKIFAFTSWKQRLFLFLHIEMCSSILYLRNLTFQTLA